MERKTAATAAAVAANQRPAPRAETIALVKTQCQLDARHDKLNNVSLRACPLCVCVCVCVCGLVEPIYASGAIVSRVRVPRPTATNAIRAHLQRCGWMADWLLFNGTFQHK